MPDFIDRLPLESSTRRTADGFLVAEARVARTGIQVYSGSEVGRPDLSQVRVYRPESAVFDRGALASYAHRPVTQGHPATPVDASNWKQFAVGHTGDEVLRDGDFVRVPMVLMDAAAISAVEAGTAKEISMGYSADLEFSDGKTPDGEPYDAVMSNFRMNHLATVAQARGGSDLKVGDDSKEGHQMPDNPQLQTVVVDGLSISTTQQGAEVITKLKGQIADAEKAATDAKTEFEKQIAAKDADLAKKDAEIDTLKAAALSDADLDKKVAERAQLISDAKRLAPKIETAGKSDAAIRKEVVASKHEVADKSDAYVDAMFDIMLKSAPKDSVRDGFQQHRTSNGDSSGDARQTAYDEALQADLKAWEGKETH